MREVKIENFLKYELCVNIKRFMFKKLKILKMIEFLEKVFLDSYRAFGRLGVS